VNHVVLAFSRRVRLTIFGGYWISSVSEFSIVAIGALAYFLVRAGVSGREEEAFHRAADLTALEQLLGMYWEPTMQGWVLGSRFLIEFFNAIYFWTHMPVIVVVAIWLFWRNRRVYQFTRNAFVASAPISLAIYYVLPTAPPRLLPDSGFVDTMALYSQTSYQSQEVSLFVNAYAAFPSLHFGWALLIAMALWLASPVNIYARMIFGALGVFLVLGQLLSIVVTGNHFLLDAVAGAVVVGVSVLISQQWRRYRDPVR
jgi:hypothetical protein